MLEIFNNISLVEAAQLYEMDGMVITPCKPRTKAAYLDKWNKESVYSTFSPKDHWEKNPQDNIGVILAPSGLCTLDIDSVDEFKSAIRKIGLTPNDGEKPFWESSTAGIRSGKPNKGKLVFQAPKDVNLTYHKLSWNNVGNTGKKHTVFELRCGNFMDVLPPSIHPDTLKPYEWIGGGIEPLPSDLLLLWENWETFEPALIKADRFYQPERSCTMKRGRPKKEYNGRDLIREWCDSKNLSNELESYGYKRIGSRFTSPSSSRKDTSTLISGDKKTFYCFSESDFFSDGHQHNAFDLMLHYDFHDDFFDALKQVKRDLGLFTIHDKELVEAIKKHTTFNEEE